LKIVFTSKENIRFRRKLVGWYHKHGRDLPWRHTRDPYAILVSEVMLQQTQVGAVIPFYHNWLKRFPDFETLANASENDVLHAWQGLGYYSRARNLHAAAKRVVRQSHGVLPGEPERIRELPGIGRYTSNAVATFAFNQSVPIVEANTARVLARLFDVRVAIDSNTGREQLWRSAESLLPKTNAGTFNSALMELGALICVRTPRCRVCPVKSFCRAPHPELLPTKKARRKTIHLIESHGFVRRKDRILLEKCSDRWRGMWMLPSLPAEPTRQQPIHSTIFPFTHHRIKLQIFRAPLVKSRRNQRWMPIAELNTVPIPSPHRRAIATLTQQPPV
jgi:A/G-specific adenine glycosylase